MNSTALDKKARRKSNRKMRAQGVDSVKFDLNGANVRAKRKFQKLETLNACIDIGGDCAIAAAKSKRQMNVDWKDRGEPNPGEYFTKDQTFKGLVLDTKKRYLVEGGL